MKKRMREEGEAALAHANRGRPSPRRLADETAAQIVQLARGTYAGFNDHHLCEKLLEREGFSLSRECLRRLLRKNGVGFAPKAPSPRSLPAPPPFCTPHRHFFRYSRLQRIAPGNKVEMAQFVRFGKQGRTFRIWGGRRESNPRPKLGKL
jgi:hypothetical protein